MDMLVAGYEQHFSESLRYWRSRFIVIPRDEPPQANVGPSTETLDEEEMRILGIEKLAEMFTKMRWNSTEEQSSPLPPIRLLHTTLPPAVSVTDESIIAQLDEIHAAGPLRKKISSEREIGGMPLMNVALAMREDDGVPIKLHLWHKSQYPDSFTGYDFVSWLVREFRDVSSRNQGVAMGAQLMKDGLFVHCKGTHGFLDG
jgi:DEP domain-containing protein 5